MDRWNAIEDRPRWVHDALRATGSNYPAVVKERKEIEQLIVKTIPDWVPCKHGYAPSFCKFSKKGVCK